MFFLFFIIIVFSAISNAHSSNWISYIPFPYQQCEDSNLAVTNAIIEYNPEVFLLYDETTQRFSDDYSKKSIPKECFLASALRGEQIFSRSQHILCEEKTSTNFKRRKKLCVNKDYIDFIYSAFYKTAQCFNFNQKKTQSAFHLINKESLFLLNIKSLTGARCLGQLTVNTIKKLNRYIESTAQEKPLNHADIYTEVIHNCPFLKQKALPSSNSLSCRTCMDPYVCLLYTFLEFEKNYRTAEDNLQKVFSVNKKMSSISQENKERFQFPIKLSEVLSMKGTKEGGVPYHFVFGSNLELHHFIQKHKNNPDLKVTSAEKTPLFENEQNITTLFSYWSHNGGSDISRSQMISVIKRLKKQISLPCNSNTKNERCALRKKIKEGDSLSVQDVLDIFSADLYNNYSNDRRRNREVAYFVDNILNLNSDIFSIDPFGDGFSIMIHTYEAQGLDTKQAIYFQEHIHQNCPTLFNIN